MNRTKHKLLQIDNLRQPEGTTKEFRRRVVRDTGGRRWRWGATALQSHHTVSLSFICQN
jgi:hypothetical protein